MEMLWTSFVLGLVGSLHCAGMCGPLALAVPVVGTSRVSFAAGRLVYNGGRITTYAIIGVLFGVLGRSLALAGLQRWVSIGAGTLILAGLAASIVAPARLAVFASVGALKRGFGKLLGRRTYSSLFLLGALNGLLPCGLVYVAAAGATATGSVPAAIAYMICFGTGTLPVMLGLGLARKALRLRFQPQKLIPISVACLGLLLLLRGMSLNIPYLSPDLAAAPSLTGSCH